MPKNRFKSSLKAPSAYPKLEKAAESPCYGGGMSSPEIQDRNCSFVQEEERNHGEI
jgi:hypothetical protein